MKTIKTMLPCLLFMIFSACNGQTQKENAGLLSENNEEVTKAEDAPNKPRIDVRVNKQYDDDGRLVKFDSTYSYSYLGPKGASQLGNDSVYSSFRSFFEKSYPAFMDRRNDDIFFNDSLFKYDFFNDDYFQKRFELNELILRNMYKQMDSIKRDYLKQNYPDGRQKKKIN